MPCAVEVVFRGSGVRRGRAELSRFAKAVLSRAMADLGIAGGEVSVLFCGDREMRRLNREYRGIDSATDVLSFPASEEPAGGEAPWLGDLAIALGYTAAHNLGGGRRSLADETALLLVHGLLHLLGWDHATKRDEARMWKEQDRLLALCDDLPRPRIEPAAP